MSIKGDVFYEGGQVSVGDSGAVDLQWLDLVLQCCRCLILRGVGVHGSGRFV